MLVEDIVMMFVLINKYLYVRQHTAKSRRFDIMAASCLGLTLALGSSKLLIYAFQGFFRIFRECKQCKHVGQNPQVIQSFSKSQPFASARASVKVPHMTFKREVIKAWWAKLCGLS